MSRKKIWKRVVAISAMMAMLVHPIEVYATSNSENRINYNTMITYNDSIFAADEIVTRAKLCMYLWQLKGCPKPTIENPYTDISESDYYYDAVIWARECGFLTGFTPSLFGPNQVCAREFVVCTLWKLAGRPDSEVVGIITECPFLDVQPIEYYYDSICWAYEKNHSIATNIKGDQFGVGESCLFGHITGDTVFIDRDLYVEYEYDENIKCLIINNNGWMQDYEDDTDVPWYEYRDEIEKIIIEDGITEIGNNAFSHCRNVKEVIIGNSVKRIGKGAFNNCMNLEELIIPASVTEIEYGAFWHCPVLDNIYFEGNAPTFGEKVFYGNWLNAYYMKNDSTWNDSTKQKYGGSVRWIPWFGERETGYLYIDPMNLGDIIINGSGYGYAYYTLTDYMSRPVVGKVISYNFDDLVLGAVTTDENGMFCIKTPEVESNTEWNLDLLVDVSLPVRNTEQIISVTVTQPSFSQSWAQGVSFGGSGELDGIVSAGAGVGGDIKVQYSVNDNEKTLNLSEEIDGSFNFGLDQSFESELKKTFGDSYKPTIKNTSGSEWSDSISGGLYLENYNEEDEVQALQIVSLVLGRAGGALLMEGLSRALHDKEGDFINTLGVGSEASVEIGGNVSLTAQNGNAIKLLAAGRTSEYTANLEWNQATKELTNLMELKTEGKIDILKSQTIKNALVSNKTTNALEFSVTENVNGEKTVSSKITDGEEKGFVILETSKSKVRELTLDNECTVNLLSSNLAVRSFCNGEVSVLGTSELGYVIDEIWSRKSSGIVKDTSKSKTGISIDIPLLEVPKENPVLNVDIGLAGGEELSYCYDTYAWIDGEQYILSESTITDKEIEKKSIDLSHIISKAFEVSTDTILELLNIKDGDLDQGVTSDRATVSGSCKAWTVGIGSVQVSAEEPTMFLSLAEEIDTIDNMEISENFTLGNPYYIQVYKDDDTMAVENDFEDNIILLTIAYDDEMLDVASVIDENTIGIYYYDEVNGIHIYQSDAVIDTTANTVTVEMKKNGEYVLGVDKSVPSVVDMHVTNNTSNAEFKAIISDESSIQSISMILDGKEVVNADNYSEFYNQKTRVFSYPMTDLASGEHTVSLSVSDISGNVTADGYTYMFAVDTEIPQIHEVTVSDLRLKADKTISVNVSASDDQTIDNIYCEISNSDGYVQYVELVSDDDGVWKGDITGNVGIGEYSLKVVAMDVAGNKVIYDYPDHILVVASDYEDCVISTVEMEENTGDAIIMVRNNTMENIEAQLIGAVYDESGKLLDEHIIDVSLNADQENEFTIPEIGNDQAAKIVYFLMKDGNIIGNTYISGDYYNNLPMSENVIPENHADKYINLVDGEEFTIIEDADYILVAAYGAIDDTVAIKDFMMNENVKCLKTYNSQGIDGVVAVNFGNIQIDHKQDVILYLVGEGQIQKITSYSATECIWDEGLVTKEPTCKEEGETVYICSVCNDTKMEVIEKTEHTYGDWVVIKDATETEEGIRQRICEVCGEMEQESIPIHIHEWDDGVVTIEPSCIENGQKTYTCTICGNTKIQNIQKVSHIFGDWITLVEPTTEKEGVKERACKNCGNKEYANIEKLEEQPPVLNNPFKDVKETDYFYNPVLWAVDNKITSGLSSDMFAPNFGCTRAEVVTFLWRTAGRPEPQTSELTFEDVPENVYYAKAVLWAAEKGIASGYNDEVFGSNDQVTRSQFVTFLWRMENRPEPVRAVNEFSDIASNAYYYKAVLWAVENGITAGYYQDLFAPDISCTRGQVVSFLYRTYE